MTDPRKSGSQEEVNTLDGDTCTGIIIDEVAHSLNYPVNREELVTTYEQIGYEVDDLSLEEVFSQNEYDSKDDVIDAYNTYLSEDH